MHKLTPEQQQRLDVLENEYGEILLEIRPGLARLAELSQFEPSDEVIEYSEIALQVFDDFWKREDFAATEPADVHWFGGLLAYFITVLLIVDV